MPSLAITGGEITDAQRALGIEKDGRPYSDLVFDGGAEWLNVSTSYPWGAWEGGAGGQSLQYAVVTSPAPPSPLTKVHDFIVHSGDTSAGGERSEFRGALSPLALTEGAEYWFADAVCFDTSYVRSSGWSIFTQFHALSGNFDQSGLKLQHDADDFCRLVLTCGPFTDGAQALAPIESNNQRFTLWPFEKNVFFEWRMFVRFSAFRRGEVQLWWRRWANSTTPGAWTNAVSATAIQTIPYIISTGESGPMYEKIGLYRNADANTVHVFHAGYRRCQSWDECDFGYTPKPADGTVAYYPAATNLVTNSGFETNTTGWTTQGAATSISRVTSKFRFGTASLQVDMNSAGSGSSDSGKFSPSLTNGQPYAAQGWILGNAAAQRARINVVDSVSTSLGSQTITTRTDLWQLVVAFFTATANNPHQIRFGRTAAGATETIWIDGVQLEQATALTPLIHTDGSTANRIATSTLCPLNTLDARRGWLGIRTRFGFDSRQATLPGAGSGRETLFSWYQDASNNIELVWDEATRSYILTRVAAASSTSVSVPREFSKFERVTVVARWREDQLGLTVGYQPEAVAAQNVWPGLETTQPEFGARAGANSLNGAIVWALAGKGLLVEPAALARIDDKTPSTGLVGPLAKPTLLWAAETAIYLEPTQDFEGTNSWTKTMRESKIPESEYEAMSGGSSARWAQRR